MIFLNFENLVKPELYVLVPVLYLLGKGIKKSSVKDKWIPFILGGAGIVLCTVYLLTKSVPHGINDVLGLIFSGITQGILCAASGVYVHNLIKQAKDGGNDRGSFGSAE